MRIAKCKGCGADIGWVKMRTGGVMPIDPEPLKVVVVRKELHSDEAPGSLITAYNTHWASCPKADTFKKEKKSES